MRVPALALCAAAFVTSLALVAPRAQAATPESQLPRSEPQASDQVHQDWVGRYCTPTGCAGDASSPAAQAASFGAAAATVIFLARRRRA